jgi:hypothetical protein
VDTRELALLEGVGIVEEMSEHFFFFRSKTIAQNPCPGCVKGAPGCFERDINALGSKFLRV